jgi:hypothetical protein
MTTPIAPATPITTGPTTTKVKPSGWWVAFAIFLLLVGPGGCSAVLVTKTVSFINGYNRYASFRVPVEDKPVQLSKSDGRVGIFLRSVNESGGAAVEQIKVTSPSGDPVALLTPQDSINAPVPSGGYLSILKYFRVGETGEYRVHASGGQAAQGAELGIGPYDVEHLSAWLAGGFAVGGAVFLIGLVMLIIVLVRRSRSKRAVRMAGIPPGVPPGAPYWGAPGTAPPPPPPGWGTTPPGPPTGPPTQYPPFPAPPQMPPQPQQPSPPPGWGTPTPAAPPPPEQWAPAPWSAPAAPVPPPPVPLPPEAPAAPPSPEPPSSPSGVPAAPVSAPIPSVRPWQDAPARRAPKAEPEPERHDDDEPGTEGDP